VNSLRVASPWISPHINRRSGRSTCGGSSLRAATARGRGLLGVITTSWSRRVACNLRCQSRGSHVPGRTTYNILTDAGNWLHYQFCCQHYQFKANAYALQTAEICPRRESVLTTWSLVN
jgi:hypothetical protein